MLEHVPVWLGHLVRGVRAGHDKLVIATPQIVATEAHLALSSPAFADGARLPVRSTADGAGVSPPLLWADPPAGTSSFALIVEDPDVPAGSPFVHAIVWKLAPEERHLAEGAITKDGSVVSDGAYVGRHSFLGAGWLPPDPPSGHGSHDYVFQLFALATSADLGASPGRPDVVQALTGQVLAAGMLVGTYSRGEESP